MVTSLLSPSSCAASRRRDSPHYKGVLRVWKGHGGLCACWAGYLGVPRARNPGEWPPSDRPLAECGRARVLLVLVVV